MSDPQLDPDVRARLKEEMEATLTHFDAHLGGPTSTTAAQLRHSIDRLMRAAARVLIALDHNSDGISAG